MDENKLNSCKQLLARLQEIKEGCELIGIKPILMSIVGELEDSVFWELDAEQETAVEYCQNMLSGWQLSVRQILEIIDPIYENEITICNEILKLTI